MPFKLSYIFYSLASGYLLSSAVLFHKPSLLWPKQTYSNPIFN